MKWNRKEQNGRDKSEHTHTERFTSKWNGTERCGTGGREGGREGGRQIKKSISKSMHAKTERNGANETERNGTKMVGAKDWTSKKLLFINLLILLCLCLGPIDMDV
jgi:hypothetical protein